MLSFSRESHGVYAALLALAAAGCAQDVPDRKTTPTPAIKARIETRASKRRKDLDIRYVTIDVYTGVVTSPASSRRPTRSAPSRSIVKWTPGVDQVMDNLVVQE